MKNHTYDVIIVGSGSIGAPLAWQLAQAGLRILVLDQFASAGQGSNKRAIGGIRATHSDPSKIRICLKSIEIFSTWQEQYGDSIAWVQGGYSFVAYRPEEEQVLKKLLNTQKQFGLNIDWYNRDDLLAIVPALAPEGLIGGTFSPEDGSASPMLSVLAFERQARACGAVFHYNEPVTGFLRQNGCIQGVRSSKAEYYAGMVVNAAGPWAVEIATLAGVEVPIQTDAHEAGITEPVAHLLKPMIVDIKPDDDSYNFYFYQHETGQIVFCITPAPPIVGMDVRETSGFLPQVGKRMLEIMPRLRNIKIRRTWRGLYPNTPDGNPIVGEVTGVQGYLNAVGMCGQGFMLGPGIAVLLRQLITGNMDEEALTIIKNLSLNRSFRKTEALK